MAAAAGGRPSKEERRKRERKRGSCAPHGPVVYWPVVITKRRDLSDCAFVVFW